MLIHITYAHSLFQALQNLISKVGIALKAFVPQLQTTFVKAVSDPSREVRARAASALAHLIGLSSRIEPLINDLVQLCNTAESNAIKSSGLEAIYFILSSTKGKLVDVSFDKVHSLLISCLVDEDELVQNMSVKCFYFFTRNLDDNQVQVIQNSIYKIQTQTPGNKIGKFLGTSVFFRGRAEIACEIQMIDFSVLYPFFKDDKVAVRVAASRQLLGVLNFACNNFKL